MLKRKVLRKKQKKIYLSNVYWYLKHYLFSFTACDLTSNFVMISLCIIPELDNGYIKKKIGLCPVVLFIAHVDTHFGVSAVWCVRFDCPSPAFLLSVQPLKQNQNAWRFQDKRFCNRLWLQPCPYEIIHIRGAVNKNIHICTCVSREKICG